MNVDEVFEEAREQRNRLASVILMREDISQEAKDALLEALSGYIRAHVAVVHMMTDDMERIRAGVR